MIYFVEVSTNWVGQNTVYILSASPKHIDHIVNNLAYENFQSFGGEEQAAEDNEGYEFEESDYYEGYHRPFKFSDQNLTNSFHDELREAIKEERARRDYLAASAIFDNAYQGVAMSINHATELYEEEHKTVNDNVLGLVDNLGFDCVVCSNVCEISELSDKDFDEMVCADCEDEM